MQCRRFYRQKPFKTHFLVLLLPTSSLCLYQQPSIVKIIIPWGVGRFFSSLPRIIIYRTTCWTISSIWSRRSKPSNTQTWAPSSRMFNGSGATITPAGWPHRPRLWMRIILIPSLRRLWLFHWDPHQSRAWQTGLETESMTTSSRWEEILIY